MSVFRDVEAAVTAVPDIVCNNGLDTGDMVVEYNETEDVEEIIAWFLKGECTARWHAMLHSVCSVDAPRGSQ